MVAPNTPRLEFVPQVNLSRSFLFKAHEALEAGHVCEAGVLLREAVRRQLLAECAWKGCLPVDENKHRSPMALLHTLRSAGHVSKIGFRWTKDIIGIGNKCAHCIPVSTNLIRDSIAVWHESIDNDPCGESKERVDHGKPQQTECDEYDDGYSDFADEADSADWWKDGGDEEGGQQ